MSPNIMKWMVVLSCIAILAVAAPTSLEESTGKGTQPSTESQSREGLTKPSRDVRATEDAQSFTTKPVTSTTSITKTGEEKRDTDDSSEESDSEEDLSTTKGSEQVKGAATENTKQKRAAVNSESGSSEEFIPDSPARLYRDAAYQQPTVLKTSATSTVATTEKSGGDEKRDTEADHSSEESNSEEDLSPTKGSEQVKGAATENTKQKRAAVNSESGSSEEFIPDSPARLYRDAAYEQPTVLKTSATSTVATTEKSGDEKRDTDDSQEPDDTAQKPTTLEGTTQNKPAVSPPLISTLPAARPSRDVEGLYQADRFPTVAVPTTTTATQEQRQKRDVGTPERKVDTKDNPASKRRLPTIPEEPHTLTKRSAKAQKVEYGRPQFTGNYRPGPGGPGNNRPGPGYKPPGNNGPRPGGPGNNRPGGPGSNRPGGPGNYRPGGPGSYRPGFGNGRH